MGLRERLGKIVPKIVTEESASEFTARQAAIEGNGQQGASAVHQPEQGNSLGAAAHDPIVGREVFPQMPSTLEEAGQHAASQVGKKGHRRGPLSEEERIRKATTHRKNKEKRQKFQDGQKEEEREAVEISSAAIIYQQQVDAQTVKRDAHPIRFVRRQVASTAYRPSYPHEQKKVNPDEEVLEGLDFERIYRLAGIIRGHAQEGLSAVRLNEIQNDMQFTEGAIKYILETVTALRPGIFGKPKPVSELTLRMKDFQQAIFQIGLYLAKQGGFGNAREVMESVKISIVEQELVVERAKNEKSDE